MKKSDLFSLVNLSKESDQLIPNLVLHTQMLPSFAKFVSRSPLSLSLIHQQRLFASSSKSDSTSRSTGDTREKGKKNIHDPKIDASHQSGSKSKEERAAWMKKEQGLSSDVETRQERIPPNEKKDTKTKGSKK